MLLLLLILIVGLAVVYTRVNEAIARLNQVESRLRALEGSEPARHRTSPAPAPVAPPRDALPPVVVDPKPAARPPMPPIDQVARPATPSSQQAAEDLETAIGSRWMLCRRHCHPRAGCGLLREVPLRQPLDQRDRTGGHWHDRRAAHLGRRRADAGAGYPLYGRVLAGGGLAMVYITAYAAHALYSLVSATVSFVWMVSTSLITAVQPTGNVRWVCH